MCREKAGFTQKQVALALKISVQAVSYWEAGNRMPSLENAIAMADLFSCSLDRMMGRRLADTSTSLDSEARELIEEFYNLAPSDQEHVRREIHILSSASKKDSSISVVENQKVG